MSENDKSVKTKNKKIKKKSSPLKKTLTVIGTTLLSIVLIIILTGSIVATALTVYVMQFMDKSNDIDLYNLDMKSTSFIYAKDANGQDVEIKRLSRDENRIPVKYEDVPEYVKMAFVCREDERFFDHDGVDFKRTFAAFANMFIHIYDTRQGGSTITQQLVKNVTGDNDPGPTRKIREIFRAMNLEDQYSKPEILEAYLNYIGFGGNTYGVQAAANKYFGKDISQISVAEAASLAAIPKDPNKANPFADPELNKYYQKIVLKLMNDNGVISDQEYEEALAEPLVFNTKTVTNDDGTTQTTSNDVQSYFIDMVVNGVAQDLTDLYGLKDIEAGREKLMNGGYKIYSTVDTNMQTAVEKKFIDSKTFASKTLTNPPQAAFICMDYQGNIKAVVGGVGQKPGALTFNRATDSVRSPGSCIKPISTYGYGLSMDLFHWSSIFVDTPIEYKNFQTGQMEKWPKNYSNTWTNQRYFTFQALQRSLNTIPAQLCEQETPRAVFDFAKDKMGITTLVESKQTESGKILSDVNLSPMTVGALTNGVTLEELVAAYQAFGNAGKINKPTTYTKVTDSAGKTVLEHKYIPTQAIDEDTAYVMNKLMQTVIEGPNGTGKAAKLSTTPLVGKTGTSQDWVDLSFVGCTPDYVSGVWYGYDEPTKYDEKTKKWIPNEARNTYYSSAQVWKNVFGAIADAEKGKVFPQNTNVKELYYCTISGKIAGATCPKSEMPGYYKPSNIPEVCDGVEDHSTHPILAPSQTTTVPPVTTTVPAGEQEQTTETTTVPVASEHTTQD